MPKNKSIGASNETLQLVKSFQDDIGAKSLDETVRLSIGWARSYNANVLVSQVELAERIETNFKFSKNLCGIVLGNKQAIDKLEDDLAFLKNQFRELEKK